MKNSFTTYRIFSIFITVLVVASISLPSTLLAAHCGMDKQQAPKTETTGEHCPLMEAHSTHSSHEHLNEDCDLKLSCACELDQQQIKAEAVTTSTNTVKVFVASVTQFIDLAPTDTPSYFANIEFRLHAEFLPLFLLNGVFLN